jgi:putative flippase GtrA
MKIDSDKLRYLLAAGWNTLFGYGLGVSLYKIFYPGLSIFLIAVFANLISISMSFLSYKLFVFRTKGNWIREYLRCYVAYGGTAVLGVFLFWFLIEKINISIWLTQLLCIAMTATASYFFHKYFTFTRVK